MPALLTILFGIQRKVLRLPAHVTLDGVRCLLLEEGFLEGDSISEWTGEDNAISVVL